MDDFYHGRLLADGYGNLLADEGERTGEPVAYHEGNYVFLKPGDKSHNDRHHQQFLEISSTTDDSAGSRKNPTAGQEHHWTVSEDDPHFDKDAPNNTRLRFDPDSIAGKITGHTDAYQGGSE